MRIQNVDSRHIDGYEIIVHCNNREEVDKVYSALSDDFVLNLYDDYDGYMVVVWSDMYDTKAEFTKDVRKTLKKG